MAIQGPSIESVLRQWRAATSYGRGTCRYRSCTTVTAIDMPATAIARNSGGRLAAIESALRLRRSTRPQWRSPCGYDDRNAVTEPAHRLRLPGLLFQQSASRFDNPPSISESGTPNTGIGLPFWLPAFVDSCRRMRLRIPRTAERS
jgi:hypothetical protein